MDKADRNSDFHKDDALLAQGELRVSGRSPSSPQRPKLIDIRFGVDLVVTRFYVVLMVGKDRRDHNRTHAVNGWTKLGNTLAAVLLLLGANLAISGFIVLSLYLLKSMLGINLLPGHFAEYFKRLLS
jgi:hypothetical protein